MTCIHSLFQQILLNICCQLDTLLALLGSLDFILWALEAIKMFKQALACQDCVLEGPVYSKVARLESKQPMAVVSMIKARDDSGLN